MCCGEYCDVEVEVGGGPSPPQADRDDRVWRESERKILIEKPPTRRTMTNQPSGRLLWCTPNAMQMKNQFFPYRISCRKVVGGIMGMFYSRIELKIKK